MKRTLSVIAALLLSIMLIAGCGSSAKPEAVKGDANAVKVLKLPHNLNEKHTVHLALVKFSKLVEERSNGKIKFEIYPNGLLGSEAEVMEQISAGIVPMTKVSAASLATYSNAYHTFGLPYVFKDKDHYHKAMKSEAIQGVYESTKDKGFIALTYYTSGARSIYTSKKPVQKLEDLKGMKLRVQPMQAQTDMLKAMGGTPVAMPYGDVYTSLQSGVLDGAENNETALTNGKHGEVSKHFTFTEHAMIPDILVINAKTWQSFSPDEQKIIKQAAVESTQYHTGIWDKAIDDAVKEAQEKMGVKFYSVDKEPFRKAVQPVLDEYRKKYPEVSKLLDAFAQIK